jgi:hypothetical protein
MKRTLIFALSLLCIAAMSCASTDDVDNKVVIGNAMESPTEQVATAEDDFRLDKPGLPQATQPEEMHGHTLNATGVSTMQPAGSPTTTVQTTQTVDATLTPLATTSTETTTVSGASGVTITETTTAPVVETTTTTKTESMTSSSSLDDDDDTTSSTTTESRRRLRKD